MKAQAHEQAPVKVRRKFDETFQREAVQNWLSSGKSAEVIADWALRLHYAWKKQFAPADAGGRTAAGAKPGSLADLQTQLEAARREDRHLREQRDILKNIGHSLRTVAERYERVHAMREDYCIRALCGNLDVSPSGYYDWQKRRTTPGPRAQEDQILKQEILEIHGGSRRPTAARV